MDRDVQGKVVVITSAAGNLGLAMVKSFLQKGAKTVIILDINEEKGNETVSSLQAKYDSAKAVFYRCNVATDLEVIYSKIISTFKTIDVLINNAGIVDELNIRRTLDINVTAVMEWTMKFYEFMRTDKGGNGGTIINVSSIYGSRIIPYVPCYHASKYAVLGFSKSIGHEVNFKKTGVRVVALCPGLTYSDMSENVSEKSVWDSDLVPELIATITDAEWQDSEAIGRGTVETFEKADSGSAWLVEGARLAEKWNV